MSKQLQDLKKVISEKKYTNIGVVLHDVPDPDCIGSALGMGKLLKFWNPDMQVSYIYGGEISHPQNKTMINVLNLNLTHNSKVENWAEYAEAYITVDVMPERILPKEANCIMAVDHHKVETKAKIIKDIRQVGACCSLIWEYLNDQKVPFDKNDENDQVIATAMLMGIRSDTSNMSSENVKDLDFEASKYLTEYIDRKMLAAIENYPIPNYYFQLRSELDKADNDNTKMDNGVFVGGIGIITPSRRDILPMIAQERARAEGNETAFIFAVIGSNICVSVRSNGLSVDVNSLCQKIFGKEHAGGKSGAGAATIPLGFFDMEDASDEVKNKLWHSIKDFMIEKIFAELG